MTCAISKSLVRATALSLSLQSVRLRTASAIDWLLDCTDSETELVERLLLRYEEGLQLDIGLFGAMGESDGSVDRFGFLYFDSYLRLRKELSF